MCCVPAVCGFAWYSLLSFSYRLPLSFTGNYPSPVDSLAGNSAVAQAAHDWSLLGFQASAMFTSSSQSMTAPAQQ